MKFVEALFNANLAYYLMSMRLAGTCIKNIVFLLKFLYSSNFYHQKTTEALLRASTFKILHPPVYHLKWENQLNVFSTARRPLVLHAFLSLLLIVEKSKIEVSSALLRTANPGLARLIPDRKDFCLA